MGNLMVSTTTWKFQLQEIKIRFKKTILLVYLPTIDMLWLTALVQMYTEEAKINEDYFENKINVQHRIHCKYFKSSCWICLDPINPALNKNLELERVFWK